MSVLLYWGFYNFSISDEKIEKYKISMLCTFFINILCIKSNKKPRLLQGFLKII